MTTLIKGASVFLGEEQGFKTLDILIKNGLIVALEANIDEKICAAQGEMRIVDARGLIASPGFIDMHTHMRTPGFEYKETFETGTKAAARGGFTTICTMPNLNPVPHNLQNLRVQLDAIKNTALINVLPFGAITVDERGQQLADMDDMAPFVCGFSDDGKGVQTEAMMADAMAKAQKLNKLISAHCEVDELLNGGYIHDGAYAKANGHKGISSASEYVQVQRDVELAGKTGCRYHVCHVSAWQTVQAVREGRLKGYSVSCEVTPHHIALCENDITADDGRFKMNPPLRTAQDRDAIIAAIKDGTISAIATDHAPHSAQEKAKGLAGSAMGVVGSETAFGVCYTALVKSGEVELARLLHLMTFGPAALLQIPCGIALGAKADITLIDVDKNYTVDAEKFLSKGRSTPFEGKKLAGDVVFTMCGGNAVYSAL